MSQIFSHNQAQGNAKAACFMFHFHPISARAWEQNVTGQRNKRNIGRYHLISDCTKGTPESLFALSLQTTKSEGEKKSKVL